MSEADRLVLAEIAGAAGRHARAGTVDVGAAVAELREIAGNRADLLAEWAGVQIGMGDSEPDADHYRRVADLLIAAGADEELIPAWIEVGRKRAADARSIPYAGSRYRRRRLLAWPEMPRRW